MCRRAAVLRQAHGADQSKSLRGLFGTAAQQRLGRLCQASIRGTGEVLRYLARYTHRVAISNRRLISADDKGVTFTWKDYRLDGAERYNRVMTLDTSEFIRRFLMHVLPSGFHRIRYYGFLTCQTRAKNIERIRELLAVPLIPLDAIKAANAKTSTSAQPEEPKAPEHPCPCCGSNMRIIETFLRGQQPKHKPTPVPPDQDRHLMMTELMLDTCRSMSVLASSRQRCPLHRHVNVAVRQNSKAQDCVTKTIRDPFTTQFTPHAAWQNRVRCRHVPPRRRLSPRRNPHSCGTTAVPNPRFPALALFGRRPSECVERPSFRRPKTCTINKRHRRSAFSFDDLVGAADERILGR